MYSLEEFVIAVYCLIDELLVPFPEQHPLRKSGFAPSFSDSETLTLLVVGEFLGLDTDKAIHAFFRRGSWRAVVPSPRPSHDVCSARRESLARDATSARKVGAAAWGFGGQRSFERWLSDGRELHHARDALSQFPRRSHPRFLCVKEAKILRLSWPSGCFLRRDCDRVHRDGFER